MGKIGLAQDTVSRKTIWQLAGVTEPKDTVVASIGDPESALLVHKYCPQVVQSCWASARCAGAKIGLDKHSNRRRVGGKSRNGPNLNTRLFRWSGTNRSSSVGSIAISTGLLHIDAHRIKSAAWLLLLPLNCRNKQEKNRRQPMETNCAELRAIRKQYCPPKISWIMQEKLWKSENHKSICYDLQQNNSIHK